MTEKDRNYSIKNFNFAPSINEPAAVTFSLKWLRYSAIHYIVLGSMLVAFTPFLILFVVLMISEDLADATIGHIFYLGSILAILWVGYRFLKDFRQKVKFSSSGISLWTSQSGSQTFTWNQIRHVELLADLIAVQFPNTAVVFRVTSSQREKFLSLARHNLIASLNVNLTDAQILQDFRRKGGGGIVLFVLGGIGVGFLMMGWWGYVLGFIPPIIAFLLYFCGFIAWGIIRIDVENKVGTVITPNGALQLTFSKPQPDLVFTIQTSKNPIPWIRWDEVTQFQFHYLSTAFASENGWLTLEIGVRELAEQQKIRQVRDQIILDDRTSPKQRVQLLSAPSQWTIQQYLELIVLDPTQWIIERVPIRYKYTEHKTIYNVVFTAINGTKKG